MFDALKKLFRGSKGPSVLGVDIGSSAIKVVQLRKEQGRAVLETYGAIALGPYMEKSVGQSVIPTPEIIVTALNDVMREAKVTTKNAGVSIPLASSLISLIDIPAKDPAKLATMVPIEARKYIPVPVSEVLLDWHSIPTHETTENSGKDTASTTEILLVAIHKDTISKYQGIVSQAQLEVSFFEIEVFSTIRAVLDRGIKPVLVVDFGASSTKLYIIESGIIRDSHIINQGSQDITVTLSRANNISFSDAEKEKRNTTNTTVENSPSSVAIQYVLSEIKRVVLQYERKYENSIVDIVFTGGGSLLSGLLPTASSALDADIVIADPFAKTETPAFLAPVLQEAGPEFAVAIGTALRKLEEIQ